MGDEVIYTRYIYIDIYICIYIYEILVAITVAVQYFYLLEQHGTTAWFA